MYAFIGMALQLTPAPVFRYKNDTQIKAMTDLVDAYQRREVHAAEKILKGLLVSLWANWVSLTSAFRQSCDYHGRPIHSFLYRRTAS
jgi:hypothetical protein